MFDSFIRISDSFKGKFVTPPLEIQKKLKDIQAYIFDWDGVFNNGQKDETGSSPFNEIDSMGTNLLRFNHFLRTGMLPPFIIISGENNKAAHTLARREHFHAVYSGIKFKPEALEHLCAACNLMPQQIAFMFDDVLDLSIAEKAGVRFMVSRKSNPLMNRYAVKKGLVDYFTHCDGNQNAVREVVELIMGMNGQYEETVENRMYFTEKYQEYLQLRNKAEPLFYTSRDSKITEHIL